MYGIKQQRYAVYLITIAASILLSCWESMREVVINPDAICYLLSAQHMSLGLHAASHLCDQAHWPFYPILIHGVATLTHFSYLYSAYLLDGFFSVVSVVAFIAIVRFFKDSVKIMGLAAVVILLSHEFNAIRESIIRDHGFWAFYLVSILSLLRFVREPRWIYAFSFSASLLIATLFRIEGIIFLFFLPFIVLFTKQSRWTNFFKLNTLLILALVFFGSWLIKQHPSLDQLGRIGELRYQLLHGADIIGQHFVANADVISSHILNHYSTHDGMLLFFMVLIGWYMVSVIQNVSLIYAVLVVFAWCKRLLPTEKKFSRILWFYVLLNVVITAGFMAENMFLSKRYLMALSLTLMIWVPFALEYLWQKRKALFALALFFMVVFSLGGIIHFGYSKKYIYDAGSWLEKNVPQNATLYSNDYQVMYYSQHFGDAIFAKAQEFADPKMRAAKKWQQYDFTALRMQKQEQEKNAEQLKELGTPVAKFINKRGDAVIIYKNKK